MKKNYTDNTSLSGFIQQYSTKKTYVDPKFQRRCVWTDKNRNKFLASLIEGEAFNPIVIAEIESGIEKSIELGDFYSEQRLKDLKKEGYKHISVDGQNRTKCIESFFDNQVLISGIFEDADGKKHEVKKKVFKDLPTRLQDRFRDVTINVTVLQGSSYPDLHKTFQNVNDGVPLNKQEKRNSIDSPISGWLNNLAQSPNIKDMWPTVITEKLIRRMNDIEFCAKSFMYLNYPSQRTSAVGLDNFYKLGEGKRMEQVEEYSMANLNKCKVVLENVAAAIRTGAQSNNIGHQPYWNLLIVFGWMYDNNIDVSSYSDLYECVEKASSYLKLESKSEQARSSDLEDKNYYWFWIGQSNNGSRPDSPLFLKRADVLITHLKNNHGFQSLVLDKMAA